MANNKGKNGEKKKTRFAKIYVGACIISLVVGLMSFGVAQKVSQSALEMNKQTVKIPSFNENATKIEDSNPVVSSLPV